MVRKEVSFWRESWRVFKNIIIANKSKNEQKIWLFFSVRLNFISLMNTTIDIFTRGYCHSWKYCLWFSFDEIKFDLTPKNSNILYRFCHLKQFDEPNRYNKYYWPSSKWNQVSLMYILNNLYEQQRMCSLWSLSPFYGFNWIGFCLYKSKFHCNVYLSKSSLALNG